MKFADCLSKQDYQKLNQLRRTERATTEGTNQKKKKEPEKLSHKQWENIMGKHRDRYVRVRGAFHRK